MRGRVCCCRAGGTWPNVEAKHAHEIRLGGNGLFCVSTGAPPTLLYPFGHGAQDKCTLDELHALPTRLCAEICAVCDAPAAT